VRLTDGVAAAILKGGELWCCLFHAGMWRTPPAKDKKEFVEMFIDGVHWCPKCRRIRPLTERPRSRPEVDRVRDTRYTKPE
jgi:hypothetical protein